MQTAIAISQAATATATTVGGYYDIKYGLSEKSIFFLDSQPSKLFSSRQQLLPRL